MTAQIIDGKSYAEGLRGRIAGHVARLKAEHGITPGLAVWKPSVCGLCAAGCGVTARVMDGDAEVIRNGKPGVVRMGLVKKLEGDPAHPLSQGRLCVRGQAGMQVTYHPDRIAAKGLPESMREIAEERAREIPVPPPPKAVSRALWCFTPGAAGDDPRERDTS